MKDILYKGKRKDNGEWVFGYFVAYQKEAYIFEQEQVNYGIDVGGYLDCCKMTEVIPKTVSAFTGLTDKNGKKIFEGDIVKNEHSKGQYQYFKVIYDERTYRWEVENGYGLLGQLCNVIGECEVIGNICDNPELLK